MKKSRLICSLCACTISFMSMPTCAVGVSGQGTWETTLEARDLDGNLTTAEAYYDTSLNITWLADANYAGTGMVWATANSWAAGLNINGITGWRLPTVTDSGDDGCNFGYSGTDCGYNVDTSTGEMASMFYDTLGNTAYYNTSGSGPQSGWGLSNTGPFSNLPSSLYWSATGYAPDTTFGWIFNFNLGNQNGSNETYGVYAWAVHSGDVGAAVVPVPAALWLLGSGLLGLVGLGSQRRS